MYVPTDPKHELFRIIFWHFVDKKTSGCWIWKRAKNKLGYGILSVCKRPMLAHRVAWAVAHNGEEAGKKNVLHKCDNPPCCNPAHLFLGSQRDNVRDCEYKHRNPHCHGNDNGRTTAKLTNKQVAKIYKECRTKKITQKELAKKYGVGAITISRISTGKDSRVHLASVKVSDQRYR